MLLDRHLLVMTLIVRYFLGVHPPPPGTHRGPEAYRLTDRAHGYFRAPEVPVGPGRARVRLPGLQGHGGLIEPYRLLLSAGR